MKLLHINNYSTLGGAETVFNLSRKNIADVVNYSAFVPNDTSNEIPDIKFKTWEKDGKLKGFINYVFSIYNYKLLRDFLKTHAIDIIHIHGFFSAISPSILFAISKAKRTKQLKVVQTVHDFHVVCPNSSMFNYSRNELCEKCVGKKYKYPIIVNNCDRRGFVHSVIKAKRSFVSNNLLKHKSVVDLFITPSNLMKAKLLSDRINEEKVVVIRNPINLKSIDLSKVTKRNKICYFGRFSREKNLTFLINAFSMWKEKTKNDFQLLLIGEGEEEDKLTKLINESPVSIDITMKKYLPFELLMKEIADSKYFCMTSSWYENAPVSIVEAISMEIIPLVPDIGGMKESIDVICQCGKTYNDSNYNSWIESITYIENNYNQELNKVRESKKEVAEKHVLVNYTKEIFELYKRVATSN